jgi:nodulation protein A
MATAVEFAVVWEGDLARSQHEDIAYLLRSAFGMPQVFQGPRSWAAIRPEGRLLVLTPAGVVGHRAFRRHFVRVGDQEQLVAETGLLAVHPDVRGKGLAALLLERTNQFLHELRVPFGLTNCTADQVHRHVAAGWQPLPGVRTRMCQLRKPFDSVTLDYCPVIRGFAADFEQWPSGDVVDLNGPEL